MMEQAEMMIDDDDEDDDDDDDDHSTGPFESYGRGHGGGGSNGSAGSNGLGFPSAVPCVSKMEKPKKKRKKKNQFSGIQQMIAEVMERNGGSAPFDLILTECQKVQRRLPNPIAFAL
jgi:hypothetical protein